MAGDWIKMRSDIYRDPKVSVITDQLMDPDGEFACHNRNVTGRDMGVTRSVMRTVTVGALVSVWGVIRHRGKRVEDDLVCSGVPLSVIDDITDLVGFGEAMSYAGWVVETAQGIEFPRFFGEFNVDPEDRSKLKNAERQRKFREKQKENRSAAKTPERNVTRNVTVTHREEKRREEKEPLTPSGQVGFQRFWDAWPKSTRKGGKAECQKVWKKQGLESHAEEIVSHVEAMSRTEGWTKEGGQYVPAPVVYLRGSRWDGAEVVNGSSHSLFAGAI